MPGFVVAVPILRRGTAVQAAALVTLMLALAPQARGLETCPADGAALGAAGSVLRVYRPELGQVIDREMNAVSEALRAGFDRERLGFRDLGVAGGIVRFALLDRGDRDRARQLVARIAPGLAVTVDDGGNGTVALPAADAAERRANLLERTAEMMAAHFEALAGGRARVELQGDDAILVVVPPGIDVTPPCGCHSPDLALRFVDDTIAPETATLPAGVERLSAIDGQPAQSYVVEKREVVSGRNLVDAQATLQQGRPVVAFAFDTIGKARLAEATAAGTGRRLAIVVGGEVVSAPVIRSTMSGGEGIIEGGFTMAEAEGLARAMRAAAPTPAVLRVAQECRVTGGQAE